MRHNAKVELSTELPADQLKLVESIIDELDEVSSIEELYHNRKLRDNFAKMAEITPKSELIKIFMSLGNYAPEKAAFASIEKCIDCGEKARVQWSGYVHEHTESRSTSTNARVEECNCDWTCDDDPGTGRCSSGNCEDTASGCGFLWLGQCESINEPC
jgi:hypothetical protein